jgi:hypothetical protein
MIYYLLVVFSSAATIAILSWTTENYADHFFLSLRSGWVYFYGGIIGIFGIAIYSLITEFGLEINIHDPWLRAAVIGMTAKAIMSFDVFSWKYAARKFPVGLKIFLEMLELFVKPRVALDTLRLKFKFSKVEGKGIEEHYCTQLIAFSVALIEEEYANIDPDAELKDITRRLKRAKSISDVLNVVHKSCGPRFCKFMLQEFKHKHGI